MPGSVTFIETPQPSNRNVYMNGTVESEELLERVRTQAGERNIRVPQRISSGGMIGAHWWVCYTTNAMRDLIREIAEDMGLEEADW